MDDTTFIKKMKNFMSLLEYCESHNLIKGDEELFNCESYHYDDSDFDTLFTDLWTRKLHFVLSSYANISILDDNMFTLKVVCEKAEYYFTFTYSFDGEELGSMLFAKTDVLNVLCFNMSIRKEFESLMLNEYSLMMQQY